VASDMRGWDVFADPLWLLSNLLDRHKVFVAPTAAGWSSSNAGSGAIYFQTFKASLHTGTTADSRALMYRDIFGVNSGDRGSHVCDYSKRLELMFIMARVNSDPEAVARIQMKQVNTEGDLDDVGLGLRIDNYDVLGEAYGTARSTVSLGTLSHDRLWRVRIVHVPDTRVEFWVNGNLAGTLTGTAVPVGVTAPTYIVVSIVNGPTGGVDAMFNVGDIKLIQEW